MTDSRRLYKQAGAIGKYLLRRCGQAEFRAVSKCAQRSVSGQCDAKARVAQRSREAISGHRVSLGKAGREINSVFVFCAPRCAVGRVHSASDRAVDFPLELRPLTVALTAQFESLKQGVRKIVLIIPS